MDWGNFRFSFTFSCLVLTNRRIVRLLCQLNKSSYFIQRTYCFRLAHKPNHPQSQRFCNSFLAQCHLSATALFSFSSLRTVETRRRASTSMYSLTFCVRVMLPERHQWKSAVQTAAVMLRTPPPRQRSITGEPATPTSHIRRAILRTPPVTRQSPASSTRRPRPDSRSHYVVISRDGRKLVTRVRVMLP